MFARTASKPLNPRAAGGLYRDRENLIKQGIPEKILKTPKWWDCYNKVKHERSLHFREANLENVLFATAGLCVLVLYFYYDNLNKLTGTTPMFMCLDKKYMTGGVKTLVKPQFALPDFKQKTGIK